MDAAQGVGEAEMTTPPANINILVVDDDPTTLNIVSAMLKTWSYQVVAVPNPIDALATLRKGKCSFDLVVTDLHMPQMNGLELQKRVHEEFELPVIMMSADDKESVILKSLEGGVVYYIVKPVSREDIQNVWQYVSQSKKSKYSNVVIEDMMESTPGEFAPVGNNQLHQGPGKVSSYDKDGVTFFEDEHSNEGNSKEGGKRESSKRKTRKRDRGDLEDEEDDDGEHNRRMSSTKKHKVVWSNSLHNQFLMAIRHIGLDKAVPKRILEYMNVPSLTRENVASHLQKYRMFLKKVAEKARLSKCLSDRVFKSNFAYGNHPSMASFNSTQREQYAEYLKQQLQMNNLGIPTPCSIGNNHNGQLPCRLNTASNLGSISLRFPVNYNQQLAALNQFAGSGQSRLLMDKTSQQQKQQPRAMHQSNGMNLYNSQANRSGLGMQMMMNNNNNVGNVGAGYGGLMNNNGGNGNVILNNGANNWMQMYSQQNRANLGSHRVNFGVTPGMSTPSIENMMTVDNNVNLAGTNFGPGGVTRSAPGFNNFMNGGYSNAMPTNSQETRNGPSMHGVRSVNLTGGTPFSAPTILGNARINRTVSSSRLGGGANQFAPAIPRNNQQQQCFGESYNSLSFDDLMSNASNIFNTISLDGDEDDIMVVNNLVMEQLDNYQPPDQQQGGYEIPVDLNNILYQDQVTSHAKQVDANPVSTPVPDSRFQANTNPAASNGQAPQLSANPDANGQFQLNPKLAAPIINCQIQPSFDSTVNDQVHLNPTSAANENPLDQLDPTAMVGNLVDISGPGVDMYHVENVVPNDEHSWIQGGEQMLNSEFDSNMFQSEDYSSLFDQDGDDDFFQAMMAFDNY